MFDGKPAGMGEGIADPAVDWQGWIRERRGIKRPILALFVVIVIAISAIFVGGAFHQIQKDNEEDILRRARSVQQLLDERIVDEARGMEQTLIALQGLDVLKTPFRAGDRSALYDAASPIYRRLNGGYQVTHFYFTGTDRVNFLRVHAPDHFGDVIDRFSTVEAQRIGQQVSSLESGPFGPFTLRVVAPWYDDGELIGYLELGKEIGHLLRKIEDGLGLTLVAAIRKEFIEWEALEASEHFTAGQGGWDTLDDHVVMSSRLDDLPTGVIQKAADLGLSASQPAVFGRDGRDFAIASFPLKNGKGVQAGMLLVVDDVTAKRQAFQHEQVIRIVFVVGLALLGIYIFQHVLGRIDRVVLRAYDEMDDTIRARTAELAGRNECLAEEVEKRIQKEAELSASKAKLEAAQAIAQLGSWQLNTETRAVEWSDEVYRIFGYQPGVIEVTYERLLAAVHPDDRAAFEATINRCLDREDAQKLTHRLVRPDGSVRVVEEHGERSLSADGRQTLIVSTIQDITERTQAEETARAFSMRLTAILDIAPEAVITAGPDMRIQMFNQSAEQYFGYSADEIIGQPLDVLIPEQLRTAHQDHVRAFERSEKTYNVGREVLGRRKDGTPFPASASVAKLEVDGERLYTVLLRDITKERETQRALVAAKEEAEKANLAKSGFLADMSHDLRTPLNAILGYAELINRECFGPIHEKYREYASDIHDSGEYLLSLVNEILNLSSIEAGEKKVDFLPVNVGAVFNDCEKMIASQAQAREITLIVSPPPGSVSLMADAQCIMQILLNLLSNAVKYSPRGGAVSMSAREQAGEMVLQIKDDGKGMPARKVQELLSPFVRGESDPYKSKDGWGLGLSIVKSLTDLHRGTLNIESIEGRGTTVTVSIPLVQPERRRIER